MEDEDFIELPASSHSISGGEKNEVCNPDCRPGSVDLQTSGSMGKEIKMDAEKLGNCGGEDSRSITRTDCTNLVDSSPVSQVNVELSKTIAGNENSNNLSSGAHVMDSSHAAIDEIQTSYCRVEQSTLSGTKRARMMDVEQQPKVRVIYNLLTRASRQKLEELMQQWAEWDALQGSSSQDPGEVTESGDKTYFPALRIGVEKSSAVSFWIESQARKEHGNVQLEEEAAPLYDRGYVLGLTSADGSTRVERALEIVDDPARCFNCGSYSHSLKECSKPRDDAAVNNARNQFKLKKNQIAGSRNLTRYYQSTPGGKYDGLRPGALDAETRQLLGIGELDPPPWLNRMRELGYPPGYLDVDDEDQPSGITIYDDGEIKEETEEGEMLDAVDPERLTKKTIEYPGINAPIPENADKTRWAAGPSSSSSWNHSYSRFNHDLGSTTRGHHHDQRWYRDFRDDSPTGCDAVLSSYPPRYGDYSSSWPYPGSSYDRGHRSPVVYDDFATRGSYKHGLKTSPYRHMPHYNNATTRYEHRSDHRWNGHERDHLSDGEDKHDWPRQHWR